MNQRFLYLCGEIAPLWFVFLTIVGGTLRPGYNHLSDTVSELFTPGAPNKLLLDIYHTVFTLFLILFGIGLLQFFHGREQFTRIGVIGFASYIAMGILSITAATIFP